MEILNEVRKAKLIEEFSEQHTLDDKLNFWIDKLPINYIQHTELDIKDTDLYNELMPFIVEIAVNERISFSRWVLNNYHSLSSKPNKLDKLLIFELLKKAFEGKLIDEVDKIQLIQNELWNLKCSFKQSSQSGGGVFKSGLRTSMYHIKYDVDYSVYEAYKDFNVEPDYNKVYPVVSNILKTQNGYTLAKYWKYLENLKQEYEVVNEQKEATLDQKILILYYLGAFNKIQRCGNATKKSIFLGKLLGNDGETIRQRFSSINDLFFPNEGVKRKKLKEELEIVLEIMKELELQNVVKNIQADLRKLSQ